MNRKRFPHSFLAALLALIGGAAATAEPAEIDLSNDPSILQFRAWQEAHALPAVALIPEGEAPRASGGSRIGGAVWLAEGEAWPLDRARKPMVFLAQVDFAEMPPLPDYPTSGVLQFFISRTGDLYGMDFEKPENGDFRVIYREVINERGRLVFGSTKGILKFDDYTPIFPETIAKGVRLVPYATLHKPSTDSWLMERDAAQLPSANEKDAWDRIYKYADSRSIEDGFGQSRVGGHPEFTQNDWRIRPEYQDVDRVLLQLWTDDENLMWGDSGQGQFMIRREDLLKRDFSKVFYQWDCY
ncbi:YwqG family protein [Altererythrobacter sp. Z27]|uniref:YwqG family protein n=1 Tax=Altererythrobacter sp. Z27 TaxID=3461147 RepID=UPI004044FCA4